jgi:acetyl-CoA acetyltransferase
VVTAVISGLGERPPTRRSGQRAESLAIAAINAALEDAELGAGDIDAVVTESSITPARAPIDKVAAALGLANLRITAQSSPVGAGILEAVALAFTLVEAGAATNVLTYFSVDWGSFPGLDDYYSEMAAKRAVEYPVGFREPVHYFAALANRYAHLYGLKAQELEVALSDVALAARANATRHPDAQLRDPLARQEYLALPYLAEPLRRADVCLLSDGAVAVIVSRATAATTRVPQVRLAGSAYSAQLVPDEAFYTQSRELPWLPAAASAARTALDAARMTIHDVDVIEIYDCFSIATLLQLEAIGACARGAACELVAHGTLASDGARPTNTHGGLLAHGYLLGANHLAEAVHQLRHDAGGRQVLDASTAFIGAGPGRQYTALVLERASV